MPGDLRWNWRNNNRKKERNNRNRVRNKCNALESSWNHLHPPPWSVEKLSSLKPVSGAKKVGDCWFRPILCLQMMKPWPFPGKRWVQAEPRAEFKFPEALSTTPSWPLYSRHDYTTNLTDGQLSCPQGRVHSILVPWPVPSMEHRRQIAWVLSERFSGWMSGILTPASG